MKPFDDAAQILFGKSPDQLDETEREVLLHSREGRILSQDRNVAYEARQSLGERIADAIARVGGSWAFIIGFSVALLLWMAWNLATKSLHLAFDPYPFIFLNLLLSTLAALQAPVIMMSQNRQSVTDRKAAEYDYVVNLRAELEILRLHDKLDALRGQELMALLMEQGDRIERLTEQVAALSVARR